MNNHAQINNSPKNNHPIYNNKYLALIISSAVFETKEISPPKKDICKKLQEKTLDKNP